MQKRFKFDHVQLSCSFEKYVSYALHNVKTEIRISFTHLLMFHTEPNSDNRIA